MKKLNSYFVFNTLSQIPLIPVYCVFIVFQNYFKRCFEYSFTIEPDTSNENMIDDSHSMLENISSIEQLAIDPVEAVKEDDELLDKDNPLETAVVPTFDIIKDELDKIDPGHKSDFESIHEELGQLEQKILDEGIIMILEGGRRCGRF